MDKRRSLNTKVWSDEWFEKLAADMKLLWLYLLSNQYTNMLGIYEVSMRRMAFETSLTEEQIKKAFAHFSKTNRAHVVENHILITNWLRNQKLNSNMRTSAMNAFDELPDDVKKALEANHGITTFDDLETSESISSEEEEEEEIPEPPKTTKRTRTIFIAPSMEEMKLFALSEGCREDVGEKAWKYYSSNKWCDKSGHKVKNWKQKMLMVWIPNAKDSPPPPVNGTNGKASRQDALTDKFNGLHHIQEIV